MNTITLDFEKLVEAMVVSFKYNTKEEHRGALAMLSMIVGNGDMYNKICEIAEKKLAEEKNNEKYIGDTAMTKEKEIQILQSLKGDTYFAQMFGDDIDRMCENISVDFPIESGCKFNTKAEVLQKELKEQKEQAKQEALDFAFGIILDFREGNGVRDKVYQTIESRIGIDEMIKFKHSQKIELSDTEINYLVGKLR